MKNRIETIKKKSRDFNTIGVKVDVGSFGAKQLRMDKFIFHVTNCFF